ncbi:MAG: hypothetical protein OXE98_01970 [Hyphomicrobiales bacterium]|nr:hypothetical protein [Hyphomicrobiales bacterium]
MKKMELEKIQTIVETLFVELLPEAKLVKVEVQEEESWEGDELLNIIIVFDGKRLDAKKTNELTWRVRKKTGEDEDRFLLFGFVVKEEAGEMGITLP